MTSKPFKRKCKNKTKQNKIMAAANSSISLLLSQLLRQINKLLKDMRWVFEVVNLKAEILKRKEVCNLRTQMLA